MAERDDGTPRRVPVVVEVRTWGRACEGKEPAPEKSRSVRWHQCPFVASWPLRCLLFRTDIEHTGPAAKALRVPACLALDEPDRTPAEAHGLGSQP